MQASAQNILISAEDPFLRIDEEKLKVLGACLLNHFSLNQLELSISFVTDEEMQQLNLEYRHQNKTTDVLSFPQFSFDEPLRPDEGEVALKGASLGDILISGKKAWENSQDLGHGLDREVVFLIMHGFLHLCGYDHIELQDEAVMIAMQQQLLKLFPQKIWEGCASVAD